MCAPKAHPTPKLTPKLSCVSLQSSKRDRLEIGEPSEGASFCACLEAKLSGPRACRVLRRYRSEGFKRSPPIALRAHELRHPQARWQPAKHLKQVERATLPLCVPQSSGVSPKAHRCVPQSSIVCPSKAPPKLPPPSKAAPVPPMLSPQSPQCSNSVLWHVVDPCRTAAR